MIIRPAGETDAEGMSDLLNAIIHAGGTTALQSPTTGDTLRDWMARNHGRNAWHVAVDDEDVLGFQWIEPHPDLPPEAVDIASFVRIGLTGRGVGSALFAATRSAAKVLGYRWLNASIRSDNHGGLTYYGRMGFQDWKIDPDAALSDGTVTGKHHKRFDL